MLFCEFEETWVLHFELIVQYGTKTNISWVSQKFGWLSWKPKFSWNWMILNLYFLEQWFIIMSLEFMIYSYVDKHDMCFLCLILSYCMLLSSRLNSYEPNVVFFLSQTSWNWENIVFVIWSELFERISLFN